eukprot:TRINITY_DN1492_c0_g1_i11.p1 TRINITY_DN1492_c0_g1~~TRINITY_DN1492_c0_g1_i11.p1  ORF type:complete len:302 (-),score=40.73 TRINITY_DN1492_c0_g1_i11:281-1186(-)
MFSAVILLAFLHTVLGVEPDSPTVLIEFAELFIKPDDFSVFGLFGLDDADVYIRCSADGGLSFPIKANLDSLNKVGQRKVGPWKFTDWKPAYGSVLYCQAVEEDGGLDSDDALGESLVVFDFLKGTTIDAPLNVSFYRMNKIQEDGDFQLGLQISLSCKTCDDIEYPVSPYWFPNDAPWPSEVASECNATLGLKAGLNLANGKCCSVPDMNKLGDGFCDDDDIYNTDSCGFDLGDCCTKQNVGCSTASSFSQIVTITEKFVREAEEEGADPANVAEIIDAIGFAGQNQTREIDPLDSIVVF